MPTNNRDGVKSMSFNKKYLNVICSNYCILLLVLLFHILYPYSSFAQSPILLWDIPWGNEPECISYPPTELPRPRYYILNDTLYVIDIPSERIIVYDSDSRYIKSINVPGDPIVITSISNSLYILLHTGYLGHYDTDNDSMIYYDHSEIRRRGLLNVTYMKSSSIIIPVMYEALNGIPESAYVIDLNEPTKYEYKNNVDTRRCYREFIVNGKKIRVREDLIIASNENKHLIFYDDGCYIVNDNNSAYNIINYGYNIFQDDIRPAFFQITDDYIYFSKNVSTNEGGALRIYRIEVK